MPYIEMYTIARRVTRFNNLKQILKLSECLASTDESSSLMKEKPSELLTTPQIITKDTIPSRSNLKDNSWFRYMYETNVFVLRRTSIFHYEACTDKLNIENYFKHLELPDTFFSFYLIVQLHLWMCQVRSMREGPEGRKLRNEVVERMWQDMDVRLSKIEVYSSSQRKSILNDLLYHHQCAMFSYDEGLLTDDKTLANALWRTLFSKEEVHPKFLELAIKYVRVQINHLQSISSRDWCLNGKFDWAHFAPLVEIKQ